MWFKKKKNQPAPEEPGQEELRQEFPGEAVLEESVPEEAVQEEAVQEEAVQEEPEQEEAVQEESVPEEPAQEEPVQEEPEQEAPRPEPVEDGFSLDAIMKEFSGIDETETAAEAEKVEVVVTGDTVRLEIPLHEGREETAGPETVSAETIRLDPVVTAETIRIELPQRGEQPADVTADTIVLGELPGQLGDTVRFTPVEEETQQEQPGVEPFSEGWEPEYEQPIGEYVPPTPIIFHPKSRLRELKRKLVAGPERRYYELSEQGFVKLQLAIFVSLLVAVLSTGATVFYELGMLENRVKLVAFGQLFGMLVAALMGTYQLMDGVADMFRKRFSLNSLLVLSFLVCITDGVFCLKEQRVPCCAAFTIQMTMSLWSAYHARSTELGQMDTMRKATRLDSIVEEPDYYDGCVGLLRGEGQVEDFMEHYQERSFADKFTSIYALAACGVGVISAVLAGVLHGSLSFAFQVGAACLLAAVPGTFFISQSRPMAILEKRLHKLGTVLCGWQRIARLSRRAVFPLSHEDLFPGGSCMLNGVKFYGSRDPDQVVAYSTAVVAADGGGLTPLFEQLLASRNGRHYEVENLRLYGGGGIGGEVCGEPVLVGVLGFLKEMGVEIPEGTMVNQAVYVAVDGELCGVFAVSYSKTKSAAAGLNTLCSYRSLRPVLVTGDFMLTEEFIRGKFGVNTRRICFPEQEQRAELAAKEPREDAPALALVTHEGLASFAYAASGARSVRTASLIGLVIHLLGGILGMGCVLVLAILGAQSLLTPVNMLLFQLIWMIPGLLVTEWTRAV